MTSNTFTQEEVAKHNQAGDCWIIVARNGQRSVFDVSNYLRSHPGGSRIILEGAGTDMTQQFFSVRHSPAALRALDRHFIRLLEPPPGPESFWGCLSTWFKGRTPATALTAST
ncbi:hypothetical protein CHLRE_16g659250v5 [Chlamydomonas reinhardtii]|uniref:Uncharacterized protein n=1 Tax=Chlamydomonas reinhardtii TaxID=3055 RepID=A8J8L1_CHLRE|nr:uncharacterized protein CHLRE_16g659250v5 [Chlamydomonas reinhardtii]PNW71557.1 hypothetical protein CHLRE_16g659250v5 [Chlamydomonas reinhardtii]|eukprot:XP_001697852.1 cytochrome b5 protein [Chlamydomonas reinhardtii]